MRKSYIIIGCLALGTVAGILFTQGCRNRGEEGNRSSAGNPAAGAGGFQFREKLSDYGFFSGSLRSLIPRAGLIKYELSTPLFTDYALKDRFIVLPAGKTIHYTAQGILDFPDSTIIIKNFAYLDTAHQKIMIETRLLVKDPSDGTWKVMDYLWNKDQTDAVKHIAGAKVPIILVDEQGNAITTNYQVPNTNDCKRCHTNNGILSPIGPKARNLNFTRSGQTVNQLAQWAAQGSLTGLPDLSMVDQLPDWRDSAHFTLSQRARAYLDVNCSHCHTQGGDAYNTGLFLEYQQTDPQHLGIMKMPVSAGGGAGGLNYDIIPGDAAHSILAYRINSTEPGTAMPELGRTVIHKEGVKLITDWIDKMSARK